MTGGVTTKSPAVQERGARSKAVDRASFRYLELMPLLSSLRLGELGFLAHEDYEVYVS